MVYRRLAALYVSSGIRSRLFGQFASGTWRSIRQSVCFLSRAAYL